MSDANMFIQQRKAIEEIDKEMALLFEKRMQQVKEIALIKNNLNMEIEDAARERILTDRNCEYVSDELSSYYREAFEKMLEVSKKYQKHIIGR